MPSLKLPDGASSATYYGFCLDIAYAALQQNGASLPEKCNAANLAGCIEDNGGYAGVALAIESSTGDLIIKNSESQNYAGYFIDACSDYHGRNYLSCEMPAGNGSTGISNLQIGKSTVTSVYIEAAGATPSSTDYLCGCSGSTNAFSGLQKFELKGLEVVGVNLCQYATSLTEVVLHEGLKTIGTNAFRECESLTKLRLPDGLTSAGSAFCYICENLQEIYIPDGCMPPTGNDSLSTTNSSAASYANGIVLKGPGAAAWKAALPDLNSGKYRKLILDPEWA